ncbi:hypothetical protein [Actinocrispum wychmicini]|uniref:Uncharacterized protein n=1 Tax=Actinocrispum wychmicini TaxID=1213861 RepID=A0A4V2S8Y7_9PSEU|nr:hypothetical protein [Actinocrispum wychmicini]TCO65390.1 hypothetical protein EV192_1011182 [Actinocrispum wychmicini]
MFDENSPEMRMALAPYEDALATFDAQMAQIGDEFAAEWSAYQKTADERDKAQAEAVAAMADQLKADREAGPPEGWIPPREVKDLTMSFGEFDDEAASASTWTAPTPPMGFPPPPPIPEPIPETLRAPAPEPTMRFGDFEDEEPASPPPPPPAPGRRRLRTDDDEDMSGQSWLS